LVGVPNYIKNDPENHKEDIEMDKGPKQIERDEMTGKDAFFALMGIKMMRLSQKYSKPI